jgi:hypothetical protein
MGNEGDYSRAVRWCQGQCRVCSFIRALAGSTRVSRRSSALGPVVAVLVIAVPVGIYFAVFGALWYGALDAGQHAILRLMLRGRGAIPSRLPRFLDYGTRLIFLQRVGGGYRFVHGSLMEHIAGRGDGGTNSVGTVSAAGRS